MENGIACAPYRATGTPRMNSETKTWPFAWLVTPFPHSVKCFSRPGTCSPSHLNRRIRTARHSGAHHWFQHSERGGKEVCIVTSRPPGLHSKTVSPTEKKRRYLPNSKKKSQSLASLGIIEGWGVGLSSAEWKLNCSDDWIHPQGYILRKSHQCEPKSVLNKGDTSRHAKLDGESPARRPHPYTENYR